MASETDDVLVVNEHTSDVRHGARNRGDVIDLSDSDDDVQVIPDVAAHPASQADAKYSMDCCGAVASIEGVQTAVESAAAGWAIAALFSSHSPQRAHVRVVTLLYSSF